MILVKAYWYLFKYGNEFFNINKAFIIDNAFMRFNLT